MVCSLYSLLARCLPAFRLWTCSRRGYTHYISSCQSKRTHAILICFICTFYLAEEGKPSDTIRKTTGFGTRLSPRAKGGSDLWCANFRKLLRDNRHARRLWFRHQATRKACQASLSQDELLHTQRRASVQNSSVCIGNIELNTPLWHVGLIGWRWSFPLQIALSTISAPHGMVTVMTRREPGCAEVCYGPFSRWRPPRFSASDRGSRRSASGQFAACESKWPWCEYPPAYGTP